MFEHLLQARPAPDRTTFHTTRAHAGKHAFLAWLSAPRLRSDHKPPTVSLRPLLPVIALALAGATLLACGTSDTPDTTVSAQTAPTSTQVATESMPPTAEKTSDTPSNGRSSSDVATALPEKTPTKAVTVQEAKPTPEPTTSPTAAPTPTATPEQQYDLASVLAPHDQSSEPVQRMGENGEPIYPINNVRGNGDPYYPQYTAHDGQARLRYPILAEWVRMQISEAIATTIGDAMFEQLPSDRRIVGPERLTLIITEELHKRMEWQVAEATADQITVTIFTHLILPDPVKSPNQTDLNHRITTTVVIKLVRQNMAEPLTQFKTQEIAKIYDKVPEFSHIVGEPEVTAQ